MSGSLNYLFTAEFPITMLPGIELDPEKVKGKSVTYNGKIVGKVERAEIKRKGWVELTLVANNKEDWPIGYGKPGHNLGTAQEVSVEMIKSLAE